MPRTVRSNTKILMVEDDACTRYAMQELGELVGLVVETAADGAEGAYIVQNRPEDFGLILMDLHMPNMSGIDATQIIRKMTVDPPKGLPIVAVTSDASYHNIDVVRKLGMNGFARKPVSPDTLRELAQQYSIRSGPTKHRHGVYAVF